MKIRVDQSSSRNQLMHGEGGGVFSSEVLESCEGKLWIVSDLHIRWDGDERALWLESIGRAALKQKLKRLVLLGDIFEIFLEDDYFLEAFPRLKKLFENLAQSGCRVIFVNGNHEWGTLGWRGLEYVEKSLILSMEEDEKTSTRAATSLALAHGDLLAASGSYRLWMTISRSKFLKKTLKFLQIGFYLHRLGLVLAKISRKWGKENFYESFLGCWEKWLKDQGVSCGVIGHYHLPFEHHFPNGQSLWITDGWPNPKVLVWHGDKTFKRVPLERVSPSLENVVISCEDFWDPLWIRDMEAQGFVNFSRGQDSKGGLSSLQFKRPVWGEWAHWIRTEGEDQEEPCTPVGMDDEGKEMIDLPVSWKKKGKIGAYTKKRFVALRKCRESKTYPCLFLDRDGVLMEDRGYVSRTEEVYLRPGAADLVRWANLWGFFVIVLTQQSGLARGFFNLEAMEAVHKDLEKKLEAKKAVLDGIFFCPYHEDGSVPLYKRKSLLRKPLPGLMLQAVNRFPIDLRRSVMVGDKLTDRLELMGIPTYLLKSAYHEENSPWVVEDLEQLLSIFKKNRENLFGRVPTGGGYYAHPF